MVRVVEQAHVSSRRPAPRSAAAQAPTFQARPRSRRRARTPAGAWPRSSPGSLAHAVGHRRADVVEEHLVDLVLAGQGDDRLDADARPSMSISRKVIPACGLPSVGCGPGRTCAWPNGRGWSRSSSRSAHSRRRRFLSPHPQGRPGRSPRPARNSPGTSSPRPTGCAAGRGLLRVRAERHDRRGDHLQAHRRQVGRAGPTRIRREDVALHLVPASPAVFDRPGGAAQPWACRILCQARLWPCRRRRWSRAARPRAAPASGARRGRRGRRRERLRSSADSSSSTLVHLSARARRRRPPAESSPRGGAGASYRN
jgi:hypothetical protein